MFSKGRRAVLDGHLHQTIEQRAQVPVHRRGRGRKTVLIDVGVSTRDDRRRHALHIRAHCREILRGVAVGEREIFSHDRLAPSSVRPVAAA